MGVKNLKVAQGKKGGNIQHQSRLTDTPENAVKLRQVGKAEKGVDFHVNSYTIVVSCAYSCPNRSVICNQTLLCPHSRSKHLKMKEGLKRVLFAYTLDITPHPPQQLSPPPPRTYTSPQSSPHLKSHTH